MNQLILPVKATNLPTGFCPADYQALLTAFAAEMTVEFPETFSGVSVGTTPPTDLTETWIQLDSLGRPLRTYNFAQGKWLSLHPEQPRIIKIIADALPDFSVYDGGDSQPPSAISGPMWQQAQDSIGNLILAPGFPLGAGTLPSGTVISVGSSGGEERHTLITSEMPPHTHNIGLDPQQNVAQNYMAFGNADRLADATNAATNNFLVGSSTQTAPTGGSGTPAVAVPHNTMPPYYGVYFIQRTNRLYYSV